MKFRAIFRLRERLSPGNFGCLSSQQVVQAVIPEIYVLIAIAGVAVVVCSVDCFIRNQFAPKATSLIWRPAHPGRRAG